MQSLGLPGAPAKQSCWGRDLHVAGSCPVNGDALRPLRGEFAGRGVAHVAGMGLARSSARTSEVQLHFGMTWTLISPNIENVSDFCYSGVESGRVSRAWPRGSNQGIFRYSQMLVLRKCGPGGVPSLGAACTGCSGCSGCGASRSVPSRRLQWGPSRRPLSPWPGRRSGTALGSLLL